MAKQRQRQLISGLGYAGLIPFVATALASFFDVTVLGLGASAWFSHYSAVILVFLSGALWGLVITKSESPSTRLIVAFTNGVALIAWLALGLSQDYYTGSLLLLLIGYGAVLSVEILHAESVYRELESYYLKMRVHLTVAVIALHVVMLLAALFY